LNGKSLGHTPLLGVALPEGEHHLRMRLDEEEGERQVTISRRGATRFIWTVGDGWQVRY